MSAEPALPVPAPVPRRGFWFHRRSLPCPTWQFWLCAMLLGTGLLVFAGRHLHPWLAVTEPVPDARYLVVEGWVPDHVLNATISIADDNQTNRVFCTGLPLERGSYLVKWKTYADVTAQSLARLGLEPQLI